MNTKLCFQKISEYVDANKDIFFESRSYVSTYGDRTDFQCKCCGKIVMTGYIKRDLTRHVIQCTESLMKIQNTEVLIDIHNWLQNVKYYRNMPTRKLLDDIIHSVSKDQGLVSNVVFIRPSQEKSNSSLLLCQFLANSVSVDSTFPSSPGIYLVRMLNNGEWENLYIGMSQDLKRRWKNHHRQKEIDFLRSCKITIEIRVLTETEFLQFKEPLEALEKKLIQELKPLWNYQNTYDVVSSPYSEKTS